MYKQRTKDELKILDQRIKRIMKSDPMLTNSKIRVRFRIDSKRIERLRAEVEVELTKTDEI